MNVVLKRAAAMPLETKAAGEDDDDLAEQIIGLTNDLKKSQQDLEKKVATMISDALKPVTDAQLEEQKKAGRRALAGFFGEGSESMEEKEELAENRKLLALFFRQSIDHKNRDADRKALKAHFEDMQHKSMSVGSDPDGGFMVPNYRSPIIRKKLLDFSPMRRLAGGFSMPFGDTYEEPLDEDTVGGGWVGETEARPETSTPQVGMWSLPLHEVYAAPKVTQKLLDLSDFDLGAWLEGKIGDTFALLEGNAFILGNGIKKPRGLLTYSISSSDDASRAKGALQGVASGHATQLTTDSLINAQTALRSGYRQNAKWLMNRKTAGVIRLFKDLEGRYIWQDGLTKGASAVLLGHEVELDETMPDVGAGTLPVAFGDFSRGYFIIDWSGIRLLRDPYTAKPYVIFYAYKRVGGAVRDFDAIKLVQIGT